MNDPILESAVTMLRDAFPGMHGVYLFGSRSDGTAGNGSDWDFGLLGTNSDKLSLLAAAAKLASHLEAEVDLVDLDKASTALRFEVLRKGKVVASFDRSRIERFEMETLTAYQNLNESRKHILRDFGMAA
jgi:predicted nucleotidyltransferase